MPGTRFSPSRLARGTAALAAAAILAGCASNYAYVQPNVTGSGGYYTSSEPYTGQGYYDGYGTGPYYPGTAGWGYYDGTFPGASTWGWGGGYWGFGSPFFLDLGISSVWGFPGYWGPWYSLNFPIQGGCRYGCRYHHRGDPVVTTPRPRPWLKPDRPPVPRLGGIKGSAPPIALPARPMEGLANRRPLDSASFAPRNVEGPRQAEGFTGRPAYRAPPPAMAGRPMWPAAPHDPARSAPPVFTPMPPPPAPDSRATVHRRP